ncbi:hypothetical protein AKG98_1064 [Moritella sp. JT01]|uniref:hypothetical protein n=1 Tax=Moritella sp. JT01 TaxID=756698 RepID=UPI000792CE3C|nr:hypothetical protein [Moritella sp. JT01]KXO09475.1 hypothetical protein AKG98_1064 [Moritella sp. JT01]
MKKPIDKPRLDTDNQVLTEIELSALREEFGMNKTHYDIHDLILADIPPEMLKALLQADSISIIARRDQQELRFPLHLTNDGYQNSLQGPAIADISPQFNQHKLHKFQ